MTSQDLKKYKLPDKPGVYRFYKGKNLLYIGKATSLKDRVRSYFAGDLGESRGPKITQMLSLANKIDWQETGSVLEALLLETELIKKYQPKYNSREKDDKSYWYVVITDEDFPRVIPIRGRELESSKNPYCAISNLAQFGPFPHAGEIKEALKIIRKIFPYRDRCLPCVNLAKRGATSSEPEVVPRAACKPCFNRQIGLCPGVCTGEIPKTEYCKIVRNIKLLFSGKKQVIIKNLEREMKLLAKKQQFEKAGKIRDQIFALNHIRDVSLLKNNWPRNAADRSKNSGAQGLSSGQPLKESPFARIRIEAYDIAHLQGQKTVGAMTVWQDGELDKSEYKKFELRGPKAKQADDPANLREILERRFAHSEWPLPDIIVVDGNQVQVDVAKTLFPQIAIVGVTKDAKHKASKLIGDQHIIHDYHRAIVEVNAEAHRFAISYHRQKMQKDFLL